MDGALPADRLCYGVCHDEHYPFIYMNASLQRMLVKDLESFQTEYDIYPGAYNTSYGLKMDISGSEQQKSC